MEEFFRFGGTVALIGPALITTQEADTSATPPAPEIKVIFAAKDLVISEIMWALDVDNLGTTDTPNDCRQWVEIYNTVSDENGRPVATPEFLADTLQFMFIPYRHVAIGDIAAGADKVVLDAFSNLQFVRWSMPGENGNTTVLGSEST